MTAVSAQWWSNRNDKSFISISNRVVFSIPDALLADLQNTVPGSHLNSVNGSANGTSGYGCLKGARRKEPQVSWITATIFCHWVTAELCFRESARGLCVWMCERSLRTLHPSMDKQTRTHNTQSQLRNENSWSRRWKSILKCSASA